MRDFGFEVLGIERVSGDLFCRAELLVCKVLGALRE